MSDQLLPEFDGPIQPEAPAPKKSRRPAKKKAAKRGASALKAAKRVPKKRRARKPIQYGTAKQKTAAGDAFAKQQIVDKMKTDFVAFLEAVCGFKLEPWQARVIKALEQHQK